MKIKYLGTAAAEGIPALFCDCENCKRARKLGGRNIRTRSQALVDDALLIDFPADTYMHFILHNMPLSKIKSCIITHSHCDHLYPEDIENRKKGFSHLETEEPMTFFAWDSGYKKLSEVVEKKDLSDRVKLVNIKPYEVFETEGYTVTPFEAVHDPSSSPVVYAVEKEGKSLLYFNDSSELKEEGMKHLMKFKDKPFNLVSFDCTMGCNDFDWEGHMGVNRCNRLKDMFLKEGIADENTIFVLHHFSHNGKNAVYDDMVEIAKEKGFLVSYDGMEIEF